MCEPITLIAAGLSAASGIMGGMAQNRQAKAEASALDAQARQAADRTRFDTAQIRRERDAMVESQRALQAGRGGLVDSGGNLDQNALLIGEYALDEALRGREGRHEAASLRTEANNTRIRGKQARNAAIFGAIDNMGATALGAPGGGSTHSSGFARLFG